MNHSVELGRALTGAELPLDAADADALVEQLSTLGWDAARLAALRQRRMEAREAWPFPVDVDVVRRFGFARFNAQLDRARELLGLSGRVDVPPAAPRGLDRDEQRLAADRPPHWG